MNTTTITTTNTTKPSPYVVDHVHKQILHRPRFHKTRKFFYWYFVVNLLTQMAAFPIYVMLEEYLPIEKIEAVSGLVTFATIPAYAVSLRRQAKERYRAKYEDTTN